MPRTKLQTRQPPHAKLGQLLAGTAFLRRMSTEDIAAAIGRSENTARSRMKDPGSLTVDELVKLGRKMAIPIDELRDAIRY